MPARVKNNNMRPNATKSPIRCSILNNKAILTSVSQKRKRSIALRSNSRNSAPSVLSYSRFEYLIWRFWFHQLLRRCNNENVITRTFYCLSTNALILVFCLLDGGEELVRRKRKYVKTKQEKNRNLAASCHLLDLYTAVSVILLINYYKRGDLFHNNTIG